MSDTNRAEGLLVLDKPIGITSRKAVDLAAKWFGRGAAHRPHGDARPAGDGRPRAVPRPGDPAAPSTSSTWARSTPASSASARRARPTTPRGHHRDARRGRPRPAAVTAALARFVGTVEQVPPAFSAAHVAGRRAHELARAGREVVLTPRPVRDLRHRRAPLRLPRTRGRGRCGKGTYIRSLARDLGVALGCGAYVQALRRESVGPFAAGAAVPLDADAATARASLLPAGLALGDLPRLVLGERRAARFRMGQALDTPEDLAGTSRRGRRVRRGGRTARRGRPRPRARPPATR